MLLLSSGGDVTLQNTQGKDSIQIALESWKAAETVAQQKALDDITDLLVNVKELTEMLRRAGIQDTLPFFIDQVCILMSLIEKFQKQ